MGARLVTTEELVEVELEKRRALQEAQGGPATRCFVHVGELEPCQVCRSHIDVGL